MAATRDNIEVEARFLEINVDKMRSALEGAGAEYAGELLCSEIIYYDSDLRWKEEQKFVRLRKVADRCAITYKHNKSQDIHGTEEVECQVDDFGQADLLIQRMGLTPYRYQEKHRISYRLGEVAADIDTWPGIPPYLELEGPTEQSVQEAAKLLGLDWSQANTRNAAWVIEHIYRIPVREYRYFTFEKAG